MFTLRKLLSVSFLICILLAGFYLILWYKRLRPGHSKHKLLLCLTLSWCIFWPLGHRLAFGHSTETWLKGVAGWHYEETDGTESQDLTQMLFYSSILLYAVSVATGGVSSLVCLPYLLLWGAGSALAVCLAMHWIWACDGWLQMFGACDETGSGALHVLPGSSAFVAGIMLMSSETIAVPRELRQIQKKSDGVVGKQLATSWLGILCINIGTVICHHAPSAEHVHPPLGRLVTVNLMSSFSGGVICFILSMMLRRRNYKSFVAVSFLAGLVSISNMSMGISVQQSVVVGSVGGVIFWLMEGMLRKMVVPDNQNCWALHVCCGAWSILSKALYSNSQMSSCSLIKTQQTGMENELQFFGIQALEAGVMMGCGAIPVFCFLKLIDVTCGMKILLKKGINPNNAEHGCCTSMFTSNWLTDCQKLECPCFKSTMSPGDPTTINPSLTGNQEPRDGETAEPGCPEEDLFFLPVRSPENLLALEEFCDRLNSWTPSSRIIGNLPQILDIQDNTEQENSYL